MIAKFQKHNGGRGLAVCLMAGLTLTTLSEAQTGEAKENSGPAITQRADGLPDAATGVWAVRFEPTGDFAPKTPRELIDRAHQSGAHSGTKGEIGYFRTKIEGDRLAGSFLAYDGDQLKTALDGVPGLEVTGVEKLTQAGIESYAKLPQESLVEMEHPNAAQGVWAVRFEPVGDFKPKTPAELLDQANQSGAFSGSQGEIGYFRTERHGAKLTGAFLAYDPDLLKTALNRVPGLRVTGVKKLTAEQLRVYIDTPQEP